MASSPSSEQCLKTKADNPQDPPGVQKGAVDGSPSTIPDGDGFTVLEQNLEQKTFTTSCVYRTVSEPSVHYLNASSAAASTNTTPSSFGASLASAATSNSVAILDEVEKSLDEEERSLDEEEKSLDEEERSLDEEEKSLDEREGSIDEEKRSILDERERILAERRSILAERRSILAERRVLLLKGGVLLLKGGGFLLKGGLLLTGGILLKTWNSRVIGTELFGSNLLSLGLYSPQVLGGWN